jgi:hypothetical protein
MSDEEVLANLKSEFATLSMRYRRNTWVNKTRLWLESIRNLRFNEASWCSTVKWNVIIPEFERRGKTP